MRSQRKALPWHVRAASPHTDSAVVSSRGRRWNEHRGAKCWGGNPERHAGGAAFNPAGVSRSKEGTLSGLIPITMRLRVLGTLRGIEGKTGKLSERGSLAREPRGSDAVEDGTPFYEWEAGAQWRDHCDRACRIDRRCAGQWKVRQKPADAISFPVHEWMRTRTTGLGENHSRWVSRNPFDGAKGVEKEP